MFETIRQEFKLTRISLIAACISFIYITISTLYFLGGTLYYIEIHSINQLDNIARLIKFVSNACKNDFLSFFFEWGSLIPFGLMGFGTKGIVIGVILSFFVFWMVFNYIFCKIKLL